MNDHEAWERGVRLMTDLRGRLPHNLREQLGELITGYRQHKREMLALTLTAGSASICRDCGGQCCQNGKYRFSGLDLLALLEQQAPVLTPNFARKPFCPYGDADGCRMEPAFRPLDCVLFICTAVEARLKNTVTDSLAFLEQDLRRKVKQAETLLKRPLGRPLLLLAEHPGDNTTGLSPET